MTRVGLLFAWPIHASSHCIIMSYCIEHRSTATWACWLMTRLVYVLGIVSWWLASAVGSRLIDLWKSSALGCRCLLFMLINSELLAIIEDLIIAWNECHWLVTCRLKSYHAWSLLVLLELRSQITGISSIVYMTVSKTTSVKSKKVYQCLELTSPCTLALFWFQTSLTCDVDS